MHYLGTVNPNQFDVEQMVFVLIWVIVGGTATFYGPILGVVVLTVFNNTKMIRTPLPLRFVKPVTASGVDCGYSSRENI